MKQRVLVVMMFIVSLALAGCASGPTIQQMQEEVKSFNLPKNADSDSTVVYVVRPDSTGTLIRFNVFLDDKEDNSEMGFTRGGQYIYFTITPGEHTIYSKAENWDSVSINAQKGGYIFIQQIPEMGIIMARNSLVEISEVEGKYHVKNTKPGTIKKESK